MTQAEKNVGANSAAGTGTSAATRDGFAEHLGTDGVSAACPRGAIRAGRRRRTTENDPAGSLPVNWAKPTDRDTVLAVGALCEACRVAHRLGLTDADITGMLAREGREISVHLFRAWREPHRNNQMPFADALRLARVLPEEAARALIDPLADAAGMVATDMPEVRAGAGTMERAGLDVATETGELVAAIASATADGEITEAERDTIEREAHDVVRSASWAGGCA